MWWWLPVRTVNAVRNFCAAAALDSVQGRGIFTLVHRYRLPHSNVSSGLLVTSYTTRLTPLTSLMMRVAAPPILRALRKTNGFVSLTPRDISGRQRKVVDQR